MRTRGFTLTELVVVLALGAAATAIAMPSVASAFRRNAVRAAADQLRSTHGLARTAAVRWGRQAELRIDAANARFWVEVDTSRVGGVRDTLGLVKELKDLGITIKSQRTRLCFDSRGLPTTRGTCQAADATIVFTRGADADTVRVSALGKVLR